MSSLDPQVFLIVFHYDSRFSSLIPLVSPCFLIVLPNILPVDPDDDRDYFCFLLSSHCFPMLSHYPPLFSSLILCFIHYDPGFFHCPPQVFLLDLSGLLMLSSLFFPCLSLSSPDFLLDLHVSHCPPIDFILDLMLILMMIVIKSI